LCNTVIGIIDKKAGLLMLDIKGFFKKGGMKWLFKSKPITFTSFPVGPYSLDMEISGLSGLRELSIIEYRAVTRQFKGERIYYAPDVDFVGYPWKILLNVVNRKIYKITAYIETKDKDLANRAIMNSFLFCKNLMGEPVKQRSEMFIWDTVDGDIALQTTEAPEGFGINIFLTSHAIRDFFPLR
jgi:hypothetical protein